jgi:hypothetical protein
VAAGVEDAVQRHQQRQSLDVDSVDSAEVHDDVAGRELLGLCGAQVEQRGVQAGDALAREAAGQRDVDPVGSPDHAAEPGPWPTP